jgi:hypothetical protein
MKTGHITNQPTNQQNNKPNNQPTVLTCELSRISVPSIAAKYNSWYPTVIGAQYVRECVWGQTPRQYFEFEIQRHSKSKQRNL